MDNDQAAAQQERAELIAIKNKPFKDRLFYYTKKSGPGWLQAAITLGGGSLAGSLFLGVILEYNLMWLQPLAMILGVIMLCSITYVTLSSGRRGFDAITNHISPVLAWAWLLAASMANIVWCLPQFSLGVGAIQENLVPGLEGNAAAPWIIGIILLACAAFVVRAYDTDSRGVRMFENILKGLVGVVVISFFLVVAKLTISGSLEWGKILGGFIPNLAFLNQPAPDIARAIEATGDNAASWTNYVSSVQKDKIIAAFGTAVGINMTFLLPYSLLRKGWGRDHREMAVFDLSIGLIVPYILATGCIVIASGSQFHASYTDILNPDGSVKVEQAGGFDSVASKIFGEQYGEAANLEGDAKNAKLTEIRSGLTLEDRQLAAMLVDRKDKDLAKVLSDLAGEGVGRVVFGIGVLGMAISTIIILMLINGFCLCEALGKSGDKKIHFYGSLIPGLIGVCFPLFWTSQSKAALAVPTSVIGFSMVPIAYFAFLLLMNSKKLLGDAAPTGASKMRWNIAMGIATSVVTFGSIWALKDRALNGFPMGKVGIVVLIALMAIGLFGFLKHEKDHQTSGSSDSDS